MTTADLVETYIRAKDSVRPDLMAQAFAPDVTLEMVVHSDGIAFPPRTTGLEAVTDVLVRRFGETYENIHTFCLCPRPVSDAPTFSCGWLVGMCERKNGSLRIGTGSYDWSFRSQAGARLVQALKITIEQMLVLPEGHVTAVMGWLDRLPYPWCSIEMMERTAPRLAELEPVARKLKESRLATEH